MAAKSCSSSSRISGRIVYNRLLRRLKSSGTSFTRACYSTVQFRARPIRCVKVTFPAMAAPTCTLLPSFIRWLIWTGLFRFRLGPLRFLSLRLLRHRCRRVRYVKNASRTLSCLRGRGRGSSQQRHTISFLEPHHHSASLQNVPAPIIRASLQEKAALKP